MNLPKNVSEAVRRRNPALFGVGGVEAAGAKRPAVPALDRRQQELARGAESLGLVVSLVAHRRRLLDPDAVAYSMKPLTDAVAAWLGVDDADSRVTWEWGQVRTDGPEGVVVKMAAAKRPGRRRRCLDTTSRPKAPRRAPRDGGPAVSG